MSDHPDITYLKSDAIGKVLAAGLAETYRMRPKFPIDYFAKWLLNYSREQKNKQKVAEKKVQIEEIRETYENQMHRIKNHKVKEEETGEYLKKLKQQFKEVIEKAEYHDELLEKTLPEGIFFHVEVKGAYIGFYEYPKKKINLDEEDDDIAHLDLDAGKVLLYVGGDTESRAKLLGQHLPNDQGVTYTLFNDSPPQDGGDQDPDLQQEIPSDDASNYIYIEDVVTNPNVHYFEIPRLGSYIAIPMFVRSYLNANSFDDALPKIKDYKAALEKAKEDKEELDREYEEKIRNTQANEEPVDDLIEEYKQAAADLAEVEYPEFNEDLKQYVLCCDTLGMDRTISEADRQYMVEVCNNFVKCWEAKELEYLKQDIEMYIEYQSKYELEEVIARFNEEEEREVQGVTNDVADMPEAEASYKIEEARLGIIKEQLINEDESKAALLSLKDCRFIKYHNVLQNAFILIGYTKEVINEPGTNVLNWRKIRTQLFNDSFIDKILAYEYKGAREGVYKPYAYINRIRDRLEKISASQEEINNYNIGLGRLLRYIFLVTSLRVQDIGLRREQRKRDRQDREEKLHEAKQRSETREAELEEAKEAALQEEVEFNEEEWLEEWEARVPEIEIPPEVVHEKDEDLEPYYFPDEEEEEPEN